MNSKDLKIAGKIGELVSHFSPEWSEYQDWLRDIVSSQSVLHERYPTWIAIIIFRWRLLYFVAYIATVIVVARLFKTLKKLKNFLLEKSYSKFTNLLERVANTTWFIGYDQYRYILQRTATLLAVAELTLCGVAALTGILLAFYYQPTALGAYESLSAIANRVNNGSLILSLHDLAGNSLIILALVQIVVMFLGREFLRSWLTAWISGICLTLTAIGLSWTAIVLNWEQTSFWRFKIELSIVASIPLVGSFLRTILLGGNGINSTTLQHMYALHSYVLAIIAIFLSITHLTALIYQEQNLKPEKEHLELRQLCGESAAENDSDSV